MLEIGMCDATVSEDAVVGSNVTMGKYVVIEGHAVVGDRVILGDGVRVMGFAKIGNDVKIGAHSVISEYGSVSHRSKIGSHVHIGMGTMIGSGAKILDNAILASGATVGVGCYIGKNTSIYKDAVVMNYSRIGNDCDIQENSVIGVNEPSRYSICKDDGRSYGSIIGNNTSIDYRCVIEDVVVGNCVNIGRDVRISSGSVIGNHAEIEYLVSLGRRCHIGDRSTVYPKTPVESDVVVPEDMVLSLYVTHYTENKLVITKHNVENHLTYKYTRLERFVDRIIGYIRHMRDSKHEVT